MVRMFLDGLALAAIKGEQQVVTSYQQYKELFNKVVTL